MWDLIIIFLFVGKLALTPGVVTLTPQCMTITPKKEMAAKWSNATFIVELPYLPSAQWPDGVITRLKKIQREYPPGRINVTLYRENGTTLDIVNSSVSGSGNNSFDLYLAPKAGFTEGDKFVRFRICANPQIQHARLFWRRVGK